MLCRYKQKLIYSGPKLEAYIYPEFAQAPKGGRRKKWRKTTAIQERLNAIHAARKFSRIVSCNFGSNDYTVTLEYRNGSRPEDIETVKRDVKNYLCRLRRIYKKAGISFKYITVFERGSVRGNIHIHIIITGGVDRNEIETAWGKGTANTRRLQPEYYDGLDDIADYLQKAPQSVKRWYGSRNLEQPVEPPPQTITRKTARAIENNIDDNVYLSSLFPGYRVKEAMPFYNEVNGGIYIAINLIRQEVKKE